MSIVLQLDKMGKKSDDAQNLVDEKADDQPGSSQPSNSRKKRRDKSKKGHGGKEMESTATLKTDVATEKENQGGSAAENQTGTKVEKKRPRDKRRKKVIAEEESSDQDGEKLEENEVSSEAKVAPPKQKGSQSARTKISNRKAKISGSKVDLKDDNK